MNVAELAVIITSVAGLLTAAAALVRAWRTSNQLAADRQAAAASVARAARRADSAGSDDI